MGALYNTVFYQPIFNLLIGIHNLLPGAEIGFAIILLTVIIKLILWPLSNKALKSQRALQLLQPKMNELKEKYKDNKEELSRKLMELYSKEKVSPLSSCLPVLVQLPVFIALYHSMSRGLESTGFEQLYPFVSAPELIKPTLFGVLDLAKPNVVLAFMAGITQFFQAKMMVTAQQPKSVEGAKDEEMLANMNKQMVYFMPLLTVFIGMSLPGGLALYWLTMGLLTIVQQSFVLKTRAKEEGADADASAS